MSEAVEVGPFSVKLAPYQKASVVLEVPKAADFLCNESVVEKDGDVWSRVRAGPSGAYLGDWFPLEASATFSPGWFYRGSLIEVEFENRGAVESCLSG